MKNNLRQLSLQLSLMLFLGLFSSSALGAFGLLESAEIIPKGIYRVGLAPQLYLGNGGGVDGSAYLDMNINPDTNTRFEIGTGVTDFWAAASAKWVPFPDYEKQPAIGFRGKLIYMREQNTNLYNTQITPIFSKKYNTEHGLFIPYAGIPMTFIYEKSTNNFMITKLCVGSEWVTNSTFQTGGELSVDLYNGGSAYTFTATALSVYFNFQFDETMGFKK
jgi:hypothetical protein